MVRAMVGLGHLVPRRPTGGQAEEEVAHLPVGKEAD